jgi:hypothetical protein
MSTSAIQVPGVVTVLHFHSYKVFIICCDGISRRATINLIRFDECSLVTFREKSKVRQMLLP